MECFHDSTECLHVFVYGTRPICLSSSDVRAFKWVYKTSKWKREGHCWQIFT